jgi:signal transduction histidine kinase/CheY-like chemotaxis protein
MFLAAAALLGGALFLSLRWPGGGLAVATYRMGYRENPPYMMAGKDGSPSGLAYEVLQEAARRAGIRLEWILFRGLNHEFMRRGVGELWPLADVDDSHQYGVTRPWLRDSFSLVTNDERKARTRIAVNAHSRTRELLKKTYPDATEIPVAGAAAAVEAVCLGTADGAFANGRVAYQLLLRRPTGCGGIPLHLESLPETTIPLGIMYQPQAREAAERLRDAIDGMRADGSLGKQFAKWAHSANSEIELATLLYASEQRAARASAMAWWIGLALLVVGCGTLILYRAHRAVKAANRAKSVFLGMVSHELRTPLQGVIGVVDLLAASELNPEQRSLLGTMRHSARTLRRIVNDVLAYSRVEALQLELEAAPLDLARLAENVGRLSQDRFEAKGVALTIDVAPGLAAVEGDETRLQQLLLNLIDNSAKFTDAGTVALRVTGTQQGEAALRVCLEVTDSGIGMDPKDVPRLFAAFQQAEQGDARRFGGLGLGLAVCKGIVDAMGGTIELLTAPGKGTTARVLLTLPVAKVQVQVRKAVASATLAGRRVLIVDDNGVNRKITSKLLGQLGHTADSAANGQEGIAKWREQEYDLILMDCQMPVMDGFEATRRIRELEKELARGRCQIVALTASVEVADQERCLQAGMDGFLGKPIALEGLAAAMERRWG